MDFINLLTESPEWLLLGLALIVSPTVVRWFQKQHKESILMDHYFGLEETHKQTLYRATVHNQLHELDCPGTPTPLREIVCILCTREDRVNLVTSWNRLYLQGKDDQFRSRLTQ